MRQNRLRDGRPARCRTAARPWPLGELLLDADDLLQEGEDAMSMLLLALQEGRLMAVRGMVSTGLLRDHCRSREVGES